MLYFLHAHDIYSSLVDTVRVRIPKEELQMPNQNEKIRGLCLNVFPQPTY